VTCCCCCCCGSLRRRSESDPKAVSSDRLTARRTAPPPMTTTVAQWRQQHGPRRRACWPQGTRRRGRRAADAGHHRAPPHPRFHSWHENKIQGNIHRLLISRVSQLTSLHPAVSPWQVTWPCHKRRRQGPAEERDTLWFSKRRRWATADAPACPRRPCYRCRQLRIPHILL
jgi:hypothetical protein